MTMTRYTVCDKCGKITSKTELTMNSGANDGIYYDKDEHHDCGELDRDAELNRSLQKCPS